MREPKMIPMDYATPGTNAHTPGFVGRLMLRPPGRAMHLAAIVATAGMLLGFSAPGFYPLETLSSTLLWVLLTSIWLVRAFLYALGNKRFFGETGKAWRSSWRHWAVCPAMAVLVLVLIGFNVPLRLTFAWSRKDLMQIARRAQAAGPQSLDSNWLDRPVQRAGVFEVSVVQVTPGGEVDLYVRGSEFMRSFGGFAYSPATAPIDPEGSFDALGGGWYSWRTTW